MLKEAKAVLDAKRETSPIARAHLEDIKTRVEHALDAIPSIPAQRPSVMRPCAEAARTGDCALRAILPTEACG